MKIKRSTGTKWECSLTSTKLWLQRYGRHCGSANVHSQTIEIEPLIFKLIATTLYPSYLSQFLVVNFEALF